MLVIKFYGCWNFYPDAFLIKRNRIFSRVLKYKWDFGRVLTWKVARSRHGVEGVLLYVQLQEGERVGEGGGWVGGEGGEVHFRGSLAWACCPNRAHMFFLSPEHTWFFAQTWHMPNLPWLGKPSILHRKNTVSLLMWGHTDFHEFGFSIVGIIISVSNVISNWGCQKLSNCPEKSKVSKYCPNCQKLSKIVKNCKNYQKL